MTHNVSRSVAVFTLAAAVLVLSRAGDAAQRSPNPSGSAPAAVEREQAAPAPIVVSDDANADATRDRLNQLLERYPPALGRVLKLDPSLLTNQGYLAPYPALASFLAQHPEVAHNPGYFLERVNASSWPAYSEPRLEQRRAMDNLIGNFTAFMVFLVVTSVLVWLIRLVVTHRRWNRLSKAQFEVHSKLLDRFTSNDELLAYIQTPAGRRFLESAPIPLQDESPSLAAPLSRILWSVQAGVVLAIAGAGVLGVSTQFIDEPGQFFMVLGIVTVALGVGFVLSAYAAYVLSRRLGLFDRTASDHA